MPIRTNFQRNRSSTSSPRELCIQLHPHSQRRLRTARAGAQDRGGYAGDVRRQQDESCPTSRNLHENALQQARNIQRCSDMIELRLLLNRQQQDLVNGLAWYENGRLTAQAKLQYRTSAQPIDSVFQEWRDVSTESVK